MKKVLSLILAAVMLVGIVTLSGCAKKESTTIRIGGIGPLTGGAAAYGNAVKNGAEIAIEEINAKGGVLGKKIVLVKADSKSDPAEAANAATKLISSDKVKAIIGPATTGGVMAEMQRFL